MCSACGHESTRWLGRCPGCEGWNTFVEVTVQPNAAVAPRSPTGRITPQRLGDLQDTLLQRIPTGFAELDRVLGGGVVPGSVVLIGGAPGVGKSTLLLQLAAVLAERGTTIYVSGEESLGQVNLRAQRTNAGADLLIVAETDLRAILDAVEPLRPQAIVIDSIQAMMLPEVDALAGSVTQVRDCAAALAAFAKHSGCAVFIIGHVTKDGSVAGPRLLEHLVDTVLYFEGETGEHRIVRAHKNRFGSAEEIGVFAMGPQGLREVTNPSHLFLGRSGSAQRPSGACVVAGIVGSRPVLVELQALAGESSYGTPRRLAANLDQARLAMIVAILERRAGILLGSVDVYASAAGGLRISEPAADLGIALAIASSVRGTPLAEGTVVFGELGLSGEVRPVSQRDRRIAEAKRLGFGTIVAPSETGSSPQSGVVATRDIAAAIRAVLNRDTLG